MQSYTFALKLTKDDGLHERIFKWAYLYNAQNDSTIGSKRWCAIITKFENKMDGFSFGIVWIGTSNIGHNYQSILDKA